MTTQQQSQTVTAVRIVRRLDGAISGGGVAETMQSRAVRDLADVAIILDLATDEHRQNVAGYGNIGCGGTWVELVYDGDDAEADDTAGQRINDVHSKHLRAIPRPANFRRLRKFIREQNSATVWDGNNHVACCSSACEELIETLVN